MHVGHPSNEVRQSLANQLQMTTKSVQVWFQNRRQKLRGQQQAMAIAAASSSEPSAAVHPVMVQRQIDAVQQQVDDAGRREAVRPYPMQATPRIARRYDQSAAAYEAAAGAAAVMHTVQGYPLPRPGDFQTTTLPAHILSELASVSAAEQDLAQLANQLMQRKVELLDNIQRLEQQSAASRHGGHAVSLSPAYLATQAATMDFAAYKKYKETNEPFRASEPLQVPRPALQPLAARPLRAPAAQLPTRWATGVRCLRPLASLGRCARCRPSRRPFPLRARSRPTRSATHRRPPRRAPRRRRRHRTSRQRAPMSPRHKHHTGTTRWPVRPTLGPVRRRHPDSLFAFPFSSWNLLSPQVFWDFPTPPRSSLLRRHASIL